MLQDSTPDSSNTDQSRVADVYDEHAEDELGRLDQSPMHQAEFALSLDLIREYLPAPARVLDAGSGPGRYSEVLLREGHEVGLIDLSSASLELFASRVDDDLKERVLFAKAGSATELDRLDEPVFDAVLMMGPLYHLIQEKERATALRGARQSLEPGGVLISAHISPFNNIREALINGDDAEVQRLALGGVTTHLGMQQFRQWPSQAMAELESAGFSVVECRNLEGVAATLDPEVMQSLDAAKVLSASRATAGVSDIAGATLHYAFASRRPTAPE